LKKGYGVERVCGSDDFYVGNGVHQATCTLKYKATNLIFDFDECRLFNQICKKKQRKFSL